MQHLLFKSLISIVSNCQLILSSHDVDIEDGVSHDKCSFEAEEKRQKLAELKTGLDMAESLVWICPSSYNIQ